MSTTSPVSSSTVTISAAYEVEPGNPCRRIAATGDPFPLARARACSMNTWRSSSSVPVEAVVPWRLLIGPSLRRGDEPPAPLRERPLVVWKGRRRALRLGELEMRGHPIHGGEESEAFADEKEVPQLVFAEGLSVLREGRAVAGEVPARRFDRELVDIDRRDTEARAFPVEGHDRRAGVVAPEPQVPGGEVPMHERPGQAAAERLDACPAGLDQLARRKQRSQQILVLRKQSPVVEVVEDRRPRSAQVLEVMTGAALGQRRHEVELGGGAVQGPEPTCGEGSVVRERAGVIAGVLDEEPRGFSVRIADESEVAERGRR